MNENTDLIKILKDCPEGFEFYSSYFGKVTFVRILYSRIIVECPKIHRQIVFNTNGKYVMSTYSDNNGNYFLSDECLLFPSKEQRDWSKFTAPWYKKERFDPKTFIAFDRLLVRKNNDYDWSCDFFSHLRNQKCYTTTYSTFSQTIPYNDDTKYLVGTTDEAPEYYKYWED